MNSGQDATPGSSDAEVPDTEVPDTGRTDTDDEIDPDIDTESLQRSRDAIDQGREAAREALPDEADVTGDPEG